MKKLDGEYIIIHASVDRIILQDTNGGMLDGPMFSITPWHESHNQEFPPQLRLNEIVEKEVK
jgi:hypothetical protein